jgi:hypothetical protein
LTVRQFDEFVQRYLVVYFDLCRPYFVRDLFGWG